MGARLTRCLRDVVFIGVSGCVPVASFLFQSDFGTGKPEKPAGWSILSLPAGLVRQVDLLAGWEIIETQGPVGLTEDIAVPAVTESLEDVGPETTGIDFRVQVFGHVNEGALRLYCFLDTENKRWFRLTVGDTDTTAGVSLCENPSTGELHLLDLTEGHAYRIQAGNPVLMLIEEKVPYVDVL